MIDAANHRTIAVYFQMICQGRTIPRLGCKKLFLLFQLRTTDILSCHDLRVLCYPVPCTSNPEVFSGRALYHNHTKLNELLFLFFEREKNLFRCFSGLKNIGGSAT